MKLLRELDLFIRAADAGSLSAAARALDLTPAAASAAIKRIEAELGTTVFVRSTRALRLTEAGSRFLQHCRPALQAIADGREAATGAGAEVSGSLRLSLPSDLGRNILLPWLDEFMAAHPQVKLHLDISDRVADVVRQPVDLALRYGPQPDSGLIALPISLDNRRALCAAPAYLKKHGTPKTPTDLAGHNCLCFMLGDYAYDRWRFFRKGRETSVPVSGDRLSVDGDVVRHWALAGHGIIYKAALDVIPDLRAGRLVRLLPEWEGEPAPLHLVCPNRRLLGPAAQELRDFLVKRCDDLADSLSRG